MNGRGSSTRRGGGIDTFLQPHNEHLSLVPVILYKLLFAIAGLRHYWPYRGMLIATEMVAAILIFAYARRRVGGYGALLATSLIVFFGPGWQDLLWPFQTAWFLTVVGGVGALMALDRRDRAGDLAACALTAVAVASASAGVAIAVGLLVDVLLSRRRRDLWIVLIPLALYGLWWVTYQQTNFNPHSLVLLPRFVFDSAAGTLSSLAGLATINASADSGDYLSWGAPLLTVGIVVLVWRLRAMGRISARVASLSAILLAFWILTGAGRAYLTFGSLTLTATGDESRYLYIGAVFVVLLTVELTRTCAGIRPWAARARGAGDDRRGCLKPWPYAGWGRLLAKSGPVHGGRPRDHGRKSQPDRFELCLQRLPVSDRHPHGLVHGRPGAGRTTALRRAAGNRAGLRAIGGRSAADQDPASCALADQRTWPCQGCGGSSRASG